MIPFYYTRKNFFSRRLTTSFTIVGIALVVCVLAATFMMSAGIERALVATGSRDNVIVTRKSATGEITSIIDRETSANILTLPAVMKRSDGATISSSETVSILNMYTLDGGMSNISLRGVSSASFELRPQIKLKQGRMFTVGSREVLVGKSLSKKFKASSLNDKIRIAGDMWLIVGVIDSDGAAYDSEIWCDNEQLMSALNRSSYSTITFRLNKGNSISALKSSFASDPRLNQFEPEIEQDYFAKQSEMMSSFFMTLGGFMAVFFSLAAIIGAAITMYTAVANRTSEIGTLRALGYSRVSILFAFIFESILISLIGGALGVLLASTLSTLSLSTMNFASFSEVNFGFELSPLIVLSCMAFSVGMGLVGGVVPSGRAALMKIVDSLRAS